MGLGFTLGIALRVGSPFFLFSSSCSTALLTGVSVTIPFIHTFFGLATVFLFPAFGKGLTAAGLSRVANWVVVGFALSRYKDGWTDGHTLKIDRKNYASKSNSKANKAGLHYTHPVSWDVGLTFWSVWTEKGLQQTLRGLDRKPWQRLLLACKVKHTHTHTFCSQSRLLRLCDEDKMNISKTNLSVRVDRSAVDSGGPGLEATGLVASSLNKHTHIDLHSIHKRPLCWCYFFQEHSNVVNTDGHAVYSYLWCLNNCHWPKGWSCTLPIRCFVCPRLDREGPIVDAEGAWTGRHCSGCSWPVK